MTIEITQPGESGIVQARITGVMTPADQQALEALAVKSIDGGGKVSVLVTLEAFEGWKKDPGWADDDLEFQLEYGNRIARMAIVGDQRWRDQALLFVGKGFRATEIEFFLPDSWDAANAWVQGK